MKRRLKKCQRRPRSKRTFTARTENEKEALEALEAWKEGVRKEIHSPNFNVQQYRDGNKTVILAEFWHHSA